MGYSRGREKKGRDLEIRKSRKATGYMKTIEKHFLKCCVEL